MKKKNIILDIIMLVLFVIGIGALVYPFVSDSVNDFLDQQIINYYQERANQENEEEMNRIHAEMEAKNKEIARQSSPGVDPYAEIDTTEPIIQRPVSFYDEHTVGVVTIPKINVRLPIFDQTLPAFLEKGAALLDGTSFPTGGENTHSVLTSHAGLMQAKLFTDLEKLEKGDQFFIEINNRTLAYEVDQIKVVLPTEIDDVKIIEGSDLVTLLTCTPYMINSHRLLVRGHRVPFVPAVAEELEQVQQAQNNQMYVMGGIVLSAAAISLYLLYRILSSYFIAKKTYALSAQLLDTKHQPLSDIALKVMNAKGTKPVVDAQGEPIILKTNHSGEINAEKLPGGKYTLKDTDNTISLSIAIKKLRQKAFIIKQNAKNDDLVVIQ